MYYLESMTGKKVHLASNYQVNLPRRGFYQLKSLCGCRAPANGWICDIHHPADGRVPNDQICEKCAAAAATIKE